MKKKNHHKKRIEMNPIIILILQTKIWCNINVQNDQSFLSVICRNQSIKFKRLKPITSRGRGDASKGSYFSWSLFFSFYLKKKRKNNNLWNISSSYFWEVFIDPYLCMKSWQNMGSVAFVACHDRYHCSPKRKLVWVNHYTDCHPCSSSFRLCLHSIFKSLYYI